MQTSFFLLGTRISLVRAEEVSTALGFDTVVRVDARGQPRGGQAVAIRGIKPIRKRPQAAHCPNERLWPSCLVLLPSLTLLYAATSTNTPPLSTSPLLRLLLLTGTCPIHQYFLSDVSFPFLLTFLAPSLISATAPLLQDAGATATVLAGAYSLVRTFDTLTQRKSHSTELEQKTIHILSGLLFAACWPIFRLIVHGFSLVADEGLIKSGVAERTFVLCLILILCALVFWRESPTGVISLAMMCGGDGVADIIGRRFGSSKLPYNQHKSWAGSISMFICGFLISIGMLFYYSALGYFQLDWTWTIQRVALVALVATVVESLPITEVVDDNITVPLVSMVYQC
ncbi:hypothetical protein NC652_026997 [Populus alba x Populus x berolinensis]|nr:hypothetical protein NC652_026997 [Populus alba x Populus x berolinensis]